MSDFERRLSSLARAASSRASAADAAAIRSRARRMRNRRSVTLAVAVVAISGAAIAAAQAFPGVPQPVPLASPSPSPSPSPPPSLPVVIASPRTVVPFCRPADFSIAWGHRDSGSTHRGAPLVFTYRGTQSCQISGYPKVVGQLPGGASQAALERPSGYLGGVRGDTESVGVWEKGMQFSAYVEALAFDQATGQGCGGYESVAVTLPSGKAVSLPTWSSDACSALEVHPFVSGPTGRD